MKKTLHNKLIADKELSTFSKHIQDKVEIYHKMKQLYNDSEKDQNKETSEYREELTTKLIKLDRDIYDEMLEEIEDLNSNNQPEEPEIKSRSFSSLKEGGYSITEVYTNGTKKTTKLSKETMDWLNEVHGGTIGNVRMKKILDKEKSTKKEPTDEDLLDKLKQIKRTEKLSPKELKELGIKTPLKGWEVQIGQHTLKRASRWNDKYNLR